MDGGMYEQQLFPHNSNSQEPSTKREGPFRGSECLVGRVTDPLNTCKRMYSMPFPTKDRTHF
eukprot:888944-Pelagomonas_calceolata.AAC.3